MADLKAALHGKPLLLGGLPGTAAVNHSAPALTPQLQLLVVTYQRQIDSLANQSLLESQIVDGVSFWISGPQQEEDHSQLTAYVAQCRALLGPDRPLLTGGYLTHSHTGWLSPESFYDLLQQSIALYTAGSVQGFFIFAGTSLHAMNSSLWSEWALVPQLNSSYFSRLGSAMVTVVDAATRNALDGAVANVTFGITTHVTSKRSQSDGTFGFGGWAGAPTPHRIFVSAAGFESQAVSVRLWAGSAVRVRVEMRPVGSSEPLAPSVSGELGGAGTAATVEAPRTRASGAPAYAVHSAPPPLAAAAAAAINASIASPTRTISPYLASMSLVYSWAPDAVYGNASQPNATMARWARTHGLRTARYPAGEASYWNWEDPSGTMGKSTLDPGFNDKDRAPSDQWMSFDEYLDLCDAASLRPLIGVNYNCHGNWWVPRNESVARATRQVERAVARGFAGALWYVGNEDGALKHGDAISAHARAIKAVDPTAKVLFNANQIEPKSLVTFLAQVGDAIDGAEFHGKWPYGGEPGLPPGTFAEWMEEVPLVERKSEETWRDKLSRLRTAAAGVGRAGLLLANNEYGLGKPSDLQGFTRYTKALVAVEFALEMYVSGYDIAAFWDNGDGGHADHADQMLLSSAASFRFNPMVIGFEMLAAAANGTYMPMSTSERRVHGFAARATAPPYERAYLLNKLETAARVRIKLHAGGAPLQHADAMVDTHDHWGTRQALAVACEGGRGGVCEVELPPLSFTMLWSGGTKKE